MRFQSTCANLRAMSEFAPPRPLPHSHGMVHDPPAFCIRIIRFSLPPTDELGREMRNYRNYQRKMRREKLARAQLRAKLRAATLDAIKNPKIKQARARTQ